jgi:hypothetical protein
VRFNQLITTNAILFIGLGIAFALYGPLMIAFYGILESEGSPLMYWFAASFARMLGAALFGFGFLLFALRRSTDSLDGEKRKGICLAMIIAYALGLVVALTQQVSIWGKWTGWLTAGLFLALLAGYAYFFVQKN